VKPSFGEKTKEEKRMQTFLPYKDFHRSAKVLDNRRLGKQRVEAYQIINTLEGRSSGWKNHPIVKMWEGHEEALKVYYNVICKEWIRRGFKHNMGFYRIKKKRLSYPAWLGREEFHLSHRSNLLRKDYNHYKQYFDEPTNLPYVWYR